MRSSDSWLWPVGPEEHTAVSLPLTGRPMPGPTRGSPGRAWEPGLRRWLRDRSGEPSAGPIMPELAARLDRMIVVVGGADDVALADAVAAAAPDRVVNAAGALSLRESAALIQRASVLVTNDSAPLHLATAVGTPIVALFGPTVPEFGFGPRRAGDVTLGHPGLSCRPCSSHGPQLPPGSPSVHAGSVGRCGAGGDSHHRECGGVACDLSWELISAEPISSWAAWLRTAPHCTRWTASLPMRRRARADVLDRLITLAQRTIEQTRRESPRR